MQASDLMTRSVETVSPDHNIRHAIELMLARKVSGLPVVDSEQHLVGMLTEGDLMRRVSTASAPAGASRSAEDYIRHHSWRVGDVMSTVIVSVEPGAPAARIAELMASHGIKRLPVVDDGRLVGIVSRADLLSLLLAQEADRVAAGDNAIRTAIRSRLTTELGLDGVEVTATDGRVTLSGRVPNAPAIRAAELVAENIGGVVGIANHLTVGQGSD